MLHPLCVGAGGGHLRHGVDDGSVLDCAGRDPDNHGRVRSYGKLKEWIADNCLQGTTLVKKPQKAVKAPRL